MTRRLWLAAPLVAVTLLVPLTVAVVVTALAPAVLLHILRTDCPSEPTACSSVTPTTGPADPSRAAEIALAFAASKAGGPYRMGANGPYAYDCSSLTRAAYGEARIWLPRTAAAQRDWLAAGHGARILPGQERPGDLLFWDSYLGPHDIGHVAMVWDPETYATIEARNPRVGIGHFRYTTDHQIFEIWRPR